MSPNIPRGELNKVSKVLKMFGESLPKKGYALKFQDDVRTALRIVLKRQSMYVPKTIVHDSKGYFYTF